MKQYVVELLAQRGVSLESIAEVVFELQRPYLPTLTLEEALDSVERVVEKREAQYAILTGVALDQMAEQGQLPEALAEAVRTDEPLYGIDEVLALAITNIYGSVGLTTFGYLDKVKPGIIGQINRQTPGRVHTFLDDLIAGVAAAAGARLAHKYSQKGELRLQEKEQEQAMKEQEADEAKATEQGGWS